MKKFYSTTQTLNTKWITLLSVLCTIGVVLLHANGAVHNADTKTLDFVWLNLLESLCYCSVPCFFMISGMTLIDYKKRYDTKTYFKKRVLKTFIPYIIWSFAGLGIEIGLGFKKGSDINFMFILSGIFNGSQFVGVYWFFPWLFVLYLLIPLISKISENKRDFSFIIIIASIFVLTSLLPFFIKLGMGKALDKNSMAFIYTSFLYPLMFACIGYFINKYDFVNIVKLIIYILGLAGLFCIYGGTILLSRNGESLNSLFKGYCNWPSLFYSTAIALLIKNIGSKLMKYKPIDFGFNKLKNHTFSIYLLHIYFLQILQIFFYQNYLGIPNNSPIYIYTVAFFVLPMCVISSWIVKKIPVVKYILP